MNRTDNNIIYDWVSFTSKIHSVNDIVALLGMTDSIDKWEITYGAHGYRDRLYYGGISIHYNGRTEDMGVWCEMSGQGCRTFETFGHGIFDCIFKEVMSNPEDMNITRLDVAYDDFIGILNLDVISQDVLAQNYISYLKKWCVTTSSEGTSVNIGSMKSDLFIRIYDKARERKLDDGTHWVRFEIQLRRNRAKAFAFLDGSIGLNFFGVLNNYLRFVVPSETDSTKSRWKTADYWLKFLQSLQRISIFSAPGVEYNEINLENFVFKQAGNSISTYIECFGENKFFDMLKKRGTAYNPKQRMLINKYKGLEV